MDLTSYQSIQTALFVKIEIPGYDTIFMSDHDEAMTINGDLYAALGQFLGITDTSSELKMNNSELTITMSGIPNSVLSDFMMQPIKGSKITVVRAVMDPVTHAMLNIAGNPTGKFKGRINNYAINEEIGGADQKSTISLICKSQVGQMAGRIAGRRTNPADEKLFFPADRSMDRVPSLANAKINFGGV